VDVNDARRTLLKRRIRKRDRAEEKRAGCRRAIRQGTLDENEREQLVRVH